GTELPVGGTCRVGAARGAPDLRAATIQRRACRAVHGGGRGPGCRSAQGRRRGSGAPGEHARARGRGARLPSRGSVVTVPAFQPADRKTRHTRPRLPLQRAVLLAQLRATGRALRGMALIAAALLALLTMWVALQSM